MTNREEKLQTSVLMTQAESKTEEEAKATSPQASDHVYLGRRVLPSRRRNLTEYVVQSFFEDPGGRLPEGMVRLRLVESRESFVASLSRAPGTEN